MSQDPANNLRVCLGRATSGPITTRSVVRSQLAALPSGTCGVGRTGGIRGTLAPRNGHHRSGSRGRLLHSSTGPARFKGVGDPCRSAPLGACVDVAPQRRLSCSASDSNRLPEVFVRPSGDNGSDPQPAVELQQGGAESPSSTRSCFSRLQFRRTRPIEAAADEAIHLPQGAPVVSRGMGDLRVFSADYFWSTPEAAVAWLTRVTPCCSLNPRGRIRYGEKLWRQTVEIWGRGTTKDHYWARTRRRSSPARLGFDAGRLESADAVLRRTDDGRWDIGHTNRIQAQPSWDRVYYDEASEYGTRHKFAR